MSGKSPLIQESSRTYNNSDRKSQYSNFTSRFNDSTNKSEISDNSIIKERLRNSEKAEYTNSPGSIIMTDRNSNCLTTNITNNKNLPSYRKGQIRPQNGKIIHYSTNIRKLDGLAKRVARNRRI